MYSDDSCDVIIIFSGKIKSKSFSKEDGIVSRCSNIINLFIDIWKI